MQISLQLPWPPPSSSDPGKADVETDASAGMAQGAVVEKADCPVLLLPPHRAGRNDGARLLLLSGKVDGPVLHLHAQLLFLPAVILLLLLSLGLRNPPLMLCGCVDLIGASQVTI